ncbi:hypothetical protein NC652_030633 [Populus alba x Populus x berolinensis]|nr:hypothetical protein NC652_030633 [Populus alba x Populus x berolinensis]
MSLLDNWTKDKQTKEGLYQVVTPSGKQRGCLVFRHNVGDDENLIGTYSRQHHGECLGLSAPKSPPCNPAYYRPPPSAPPYMD